MRLRGRKGIREVIESMPELIVLDPAPLKGKWRERFGSGGPIHVELGMGKGKFISEMSVRFPDINFIGIDMYDELIRRASDKAAAAWHPLGKAIPPNLILVRANVEQLETIFEPGEIERIYLNFSDPWPKKRHAKRRLTHPRFLRRYVELLNERGEIHFKTDSRLLFEYSLNSFSDMEIPLRNISLDLHRGGLREDLVLTEYETKFVEQGMPIYRLEAVIGEEALRLHREAKRAELDRQIKQAKPASSRST